MTAAAWLKTDEEPWYLHVATPLYPDQGPLAAYGAADAVLRKLDDPLISGSEIKLISPANPIARDLLKLMLRHTRRSGYPFRSCILGGTMVEQGYIYSAAVFAPLRPGAMTAEEIGEEVFRLFQRGPGEQQPSHVTLKDGTTFDGIPDNFHRDLDRDTSRIRFSTGPGLESREFPIGDIESIR